jgi:D-apionolactonase
MSRNGSAMPGPGGAAGGRDGAPRLGRGRLALEIADGAVRAVSFDGTEAVRGIDYPIRDADWRTLVVEETEAQAGTDSYLRRFRSADGAFEGTFTLRIEAEEDAARLDAAIEIHALRDTAVNRVGFVLLHPAAAGAALEVVRGDGRREEARFPRHVSPAQPVFDIARLRHRIGPVEVEIAFEGETFEMEDQRNWTDASFKTYCRPLALPRPFPIVSGETIRQRIAVTLRAAGAATAAAAATAPARCPMPAITLAHEAALSGSPPAALARLGAAGTLLRVDAARPTLDLPPSLGPVTLEIVTEGDAGGDIRRVQAGCAASGLAPARVVGLPRPYLASHQPEGPWPDGPAPMDLVPLLRRAFPGAEVGGGMLTNFTEFNRHRPDPERIDFATFGTTAIVHAADDRSVLETLEALGDVFASARALAGPRPLRLGLVSIGMRGNPYGAAVAENPARRRVAMALDDPRQVRALRGGLRRRGRRRGRKIGRREPCPRHDGRAHRPRHRRSALADLPRRRRPRGTGRGRGRGVGRPRLRPRDHPRPRPARHRRDCGQSGARGRGDCPGRRHRARAQCGLRPRGRIRAGLDRGRRRGAAAPRTPCRRDPEGGGMSGAAGGSSR